MTDKDKLQLAREALQWADTYIKGYLPDGNTMSEKEIKQYMEDLENMVSNALALLSAATHYVHCNSAGAIFVKDADFFKSQGGLKETWGKAWEPVIAESIDDARRQGAKIFNVKPQSAKQGDYRDIPKQMANAFEKDNMKKAFDIIAPNNIKPQSLKGDDDNILKPITKFTADSNYPPESSDE